MSEGKIKGLRKQAERATLDFPKDELESGFKSAMEFAADYFETVDGWPVFPQVEFDRLRDLLKEPLPRRPESLVQVIEEVKERILPNCRHNLHPRFFGYVSSSGNPAGAVADFLTATLNQNVTAWRSAPAGVEIEHVTAGWIKEILGYPKASLGMFTSGGSTATLQALAVARDFAVRARNRGRVKRPRIHDGMRLYVSDQGHMSVPKAAAILGLGRSAVQVVPANERYEMDLGALQDAIRKDRRAGRQPFCVVGNAGTVNTGAIDDLRGIATICRREKLWFHVDGAYGGFAAMSPVGRRRLRGMELADSIALDPHKWMFQPLDVGCVLIRNRQNALRTFGRSGDYARVIGGAPGEEFAFFEHGIELSRRFRALKIWIAFKCYGVDTLSACIEKNLRMAQELKRLVESHPDLDLMAPVELSIVCFRYVPARIRGLLENANRSTQTRCEALLNDINRSLMIKLQREGVAYVSNALLDGRFVLRPCILSYRTELADLQILVREVVRLGKEIDELALKGLRVSGEDLFTR